MYPNFKLRYTTDHFHFTSDIWQFGLGIHHNISETYLYIDMYKYRLVIGKIYKLRGGQ